MIPADFRNENQIAALHIVAQLAGVGRLALQIQFLMQMALYLRNHFHRFEPFSIDMIFFKVACRCVHTLDIDFDQLINIRSQHFHRDLAPRPLTRANGRPMYLRNRSGGHIVIIKRTEQLIHRLPQLALNDGANRRGRNRRDAVLQMRQLLDVFGRQNIRAGGEHLPQLDENGSE